MDVCTLYISPVAVAVKLHFLRLSVGSTVFSPSTETGGKLGINNLPCVYLFCRYFVIIYYCEYNESNGFQYYYTGQIYTSYFTFHFPVFCLYFSAYLNSNPRPDWVRRVTRLDDVGGGGLKVPDLVSSKVIFVAENIKRRWKDIVELCRIQSC